MRRIPVAYEQPVPWHGPEAVYDDGRYGQKIDYAAPLDPPRKADEEQWADRLLHSAGKR